MSPDKWQKVRVLSEPHLVLRPAASQSRTLSTGLVLELCAPMASFSTISKENWTPAHSSVKPQINEELAPHLLHSVMGEGK